MPSAPLSRSAQRVQDALTALGFSMGQVVELPATTRTAAEAAAAIGCTIPQIAKSLVFKGGQSGAPVLVIASGANRVDTALVAGALPLVGRRRFCARQTGFVGGPPVGHDARCAPSLTRICASST